jgi:hypothetical protein
MEQNFLKQKQKVINILNEIVEHNLSKQQKELYDEFYYGNEDISFDKMVLSLKKRLFEKFISGN